MTTFDPWEPYRDLRFAGTREHPRFGTCFIAEGGILVAPNHISWFDPFAAAYSMWMADRPPHFLGKESVFRIPFIGRLLARAGQIPVYRDTPEAGDAVRDALAALDRGECVVIYPEGTITRDPDLWPMAPKTGAVRLALASGRPLFPMAQWGAQDVMRPYKRELRLLPRKTIRVVIGDPVDLSDLASRPLDASTLAIAADRLMDAITELLAGLRNQPAPATRMVFHRKPGDSDPAAVDGQGDGP